MTANFNQPVMAVQKPPRYFRWWTWLMLALVFFFGLVGRFYDLDDAPLDFHPTRQLHSMLIARGMYYEGLKEVDPDQRAIAISQRQAEGVIEPPIMESLTALGYHLVGSDDLRVPRILSITFWTLGAVGLFLLLRDLAGSPAAVVGMAYYMLLPYALYASRSFQPEPLMTAAIIWAWWGMRQWVKNKNWKWTILAGLLAGFAILVKSPAVFFIAPAWLGLILSDLGFLKAIKIRQVWTLVLLTVLPYAIYHIFGMVITGFLQGQMSLRFFPSLWKDIFHYLKWKEVIAETLGIEFFLLALMGTLLIKNKPLRVMFISIWVGYFLYGMTFSYHIVTHDYYQIPLVPAIAVGLAVAASALINQIKGSKAFFMLVLSVMLFFWMAFNFWDARMTLKHADFRQEPVFWSEVGQKLGKYSTVSLTEDYGSRLAYWGWKPTIHWMSLGDLTYRELGGQQLDPQAMFLEAIAGRERFLVTHFAELDRQPEVKQFLYEGFTILDEGPRYVIFNLQQPLQDSGVEP